MDIIDPFKSDESIVDPFKQPAQPTQPTAPPEPSGFLRRAADVPLAALKGAIGIPEAAVGLADIVTGGYAGKGAEALGFRPKEAKAIIDTWESPELQQAKAKVQEAKGFMPTVRAMVQHPSTIVEAAAESAPSMLGGAAVGRGLLKIAPKAVGAVAGALKVSPEVLAAGIGEGAVTAGQNAEQVRQESTDKLLNFKQAATQLASGAITGAIGIASGGLATKLGLGDIDALLVGGKGAASNKSLLRRVAEGAFTEGIMEELPQSAQEQVAQNLSLNKPWNEGVAEAAAQGMLVGGMMGMAANVRPQPKTAPDPIKTVTEALNTALDPTNDIGLAEALDLAQVRESQTAAAEIAPKVVEQAIQDDKLAEALNLPPVEPTQPAPVAEPVPPAQPAQDFTQQPLPGVEAQAQPEVAPELPPMTDPLDALKGYRSPEAAAKKIEQTGRASEMSVVQRPSDGMSVIVPKTPLPETHVQSRFAWNFPLPHPEMALGTREHALSLLEQGKIDLDTLAFATQAGWAEMPELVLTKSGNPFKSEKAALSRIDTATHDIVPVEGGFAGRIKEVSDAIAKGTRGEEIPSELAGVAQGAVGEGTYRNIPSHVEGAGIETGLGDSVLATTEGQEVATKIETTQAIKPDASIRLGDGIFPVTHVINQRSNEQTGYSLVTLPEGFGVIATNDNTPIGRIEPNDRGKMMFISNGEPVEPDVLAMHVLPLATQIATQNKPSGIDYSVSKADFAEITKDMLKPAIKSGGKLDVGTLQDTHYDLAAADKAFKSTGEGSTGFVTPEGKMLTRKEAVGWLKINRPEVYKRLDAVTIKNGLETQAYAQAEGVMTENAALATEFMRRQFGTEYSVGKPSGVKAFDVQQAVKGLGANIDVYQSEMVVPKDVVVDFTKKGIHPDAFYNRATGRIGIVADNLKDISQVKEKLRHEWFHAGAVDSELQQVYDHFKDTQDKTFNAIAKERGFDLSTQEGQLRTAGEYTAQLAETDPKNTFVQKVVSKIRSWLRKLGLRVDFKAYEVPTLIRTAIERAQNNAIVDVMVEKAGGKTAKGAGTEYSGLLKKLEPFFSQLNKVVNLKMGGKIDMKSLTNMLKNNGVTDAEITNLLSGLTGTVTKQQVLDTIAANTTEFKDVMLGDDNQAIKEELASKRAEASLRLKELSKRPPTIDIMSEISQLHNTIDDLDEQATALEDTETHFSQYTEPGAVEGSYREMFVTSPKEAGITQEMEIKAAKAYLVGEGVDLEDFGYANEPDYIQLAQHKGFKWSTGNWLDGHSQYSNIQNPIVRIRFNERVADDKRILFVEEMQGPSDANQQKMPEYLRKRIYDVGVKRVLAYAKENGFDGVAWTTGEMQAKRYDLSKSIDELIATKNPDGTYKLEATLPGGGSHNVGNAIPATQLESYIGKNLASKIAEQTTKSEVYNADDLKVGGEGLKSLYDKTLPALFKKYGKEGVGSVSIGEGQARPTIKRGFDTKEQAEEWLDAQGDENFIVRLNRENGSYDVIDKTAVSKNISVQYTPITETTPSTYPQYSIASDLSSKTKASMAVNTWFKGSDVKNTLNDTLNTVMRYIMPTDRIIGMASTQAEYKPIKKLMNQYRAQRQEKAGHVQAQMGDAQNVVKAIEKSFKTKADLQSLSDLVFKATNMQLHADGAASGWTEESWAANGMVDQYGTLKEAQAKLTAQYNKLTPDQKIAHGSMLRQLQTVYLEGREAALSPWRQNFPELYPQAEAYLADSELEVEQDVKDLADTIKRINEQYPMLRGDYMPLMRFGQFMVRTFEMAEGEKGKRVSNHFFDSQSEAIAFVESINNNPLLNQHAEIETTKALGDKGVVNIPAAMIDKLKLAAEARGLSGDGIEQLMQDAEALRINMMPRLTVAGQKLRREGVEGFSTNVLKVFANYVRNNANANAGLMYGSKIGQTFRDMNNVIKEYREQEGYDPKAAIDMDKLYKHLYENEQSSSHTKITEATKAIGKGSFLWYLSSPSIWAVQWSQPFMVTVPKIASKFGYGTALKAYSQAAKRYLHGEFSDSKIDAFNREHEFVGDKIYALIEKSREDVSQRPAAEKEIQNIFKAYTSKADQRLIILKVLSLQGRIDLSMSHSLGELAAGSNSGDRLADKMATMSKKGFDKAAFFMQHSETGSRRSAAIASFELAFKDQGFIGANDYASDVINDTLFDFDSANRGKAWQSNAGHILGQFQFFRLHMLGKMIQLAKDATNIEYNQVANDPASTEAEKAAALAKRNESRKEMAYMVGTSFALAGAGGTPLAMAFGNTLTNALWSALSMAFGDPDDPWDAKREFELAVREVMGETTGDVVLKGLPSLVGMDISQRIGLGNIGDVVMGDPPAGVGPTAKANWYAGRLLGPAWGMVSDTMRAGDALADGDLAKAIQFSSPKVIRDLIKASEMGEHGVEGGGKTLLKTEDINPASYALMMVGINPLEVSLAGEESRYLKKISTELSSRRSKLINKLAESVLDGDVDAQDSAKEAITNWNATNPKLGVTGQEILSRIKRVRNAREGVLTEKERIIKSEYGVEGGE